MIALDTNVLIRFLVTDDKSQSQRAYQLFRKAETDKQALFIPILVVLEMIWVLQSVYDVDDQDIIAAITNLLAMPILRCEQQEVLRQFVISARETRLGLADLLIAHSARASECETVMTFEKKAAGSEFFQLLK